MSLRYLLDTNVVSHIMQGRDGDLLKRLTQLQVGQVAISSVTLAELEYGIRRRGQPTRLRNALRQVLLHMEVLPWDEPVAVCYGEMCADLEAVGTNLSDFDMMIAAHAVAKELTLISRDKAFAQVAALTTPKLKLEVW